MILGESVAIALIGGVARPGAGWRASASSSRQAPLLFVDLKALHVPPVWLALACCWRS